MVSLAILDTAEGADCPNGWTPLTCLKLVTDQAVTQTAAKDACNALSAGARLASAPTNHAYAAIKRLAEGGGTDIKGVWLGLERERDGTTWKWSDGNTVDKGITDWFSGEPNNVGGNEDCVAMIVPYGWFDEGCNVPWKKFNYMCQLDLTEGADCPDGWTPLTCLKLVTDQAVTQTVAKYACNALSAGARLASAPTNHAYAAIKRLLEGGGTEIGGTWIGLERYGTTWMWSDGNTVDKGIMDWASGEPNNSGGSEDCVAMRSLSHLDWKSYDEECASTSDWGFNYMCQLDLA